MSAALLIILAAFAMATAAPAGHGFTPVLAPRTWSFPRDHGAHRDFQTEWWYWTGHLQSNGHRFGYEVVFFRRAIAPPDDLGAGFEGWTAADLYPAHVALTDIDGRTFRHEQRLRRAVGGVAGADTADLRLWCGDWRARHEDGVWQVSAGGADWHLKLVMTADKPPVRHGRDGLSRKGPEPGQASYYYSLTRLDTRGTLTRNGRAEPVIGLSWMDHEFFSSDLDTTLAGWDWFSLQLEDRTELMLYRLRRTNGTAGDWVSGTWIDAAGVARPLAREEIVIDATGSWTSPHTGAVYPAGWTVRVPSLDLALTVQPTVADQELDTRGSTGIAYWEGSVAAVGRRGGREVSGAGYVELTGYDGRVPMSKGSR